MKFGNKSSPNYPTPQDVHMRLAGSIIRYDGKPVSVTTEGYNLHLQDCLSDVKFTVNVEDPLLDVSSPPLGYACDQNYAWYLQRYPYRKQKQGISPENTFQLFEGSEMPQEHTLDIRNRLVAQAILGWYPSLGECVTNLSRKAGKAVAQAFHRRFALVKTKTDGLFWLSHASRKIGLFSAAHRQAVLLPRYHQSPISDELSKYMSIAHQSLREVDE